MMWGLDQRYCNLPCGIACMYRNAPTSNGSTFLLIYRDSVFADHACFCLVGVHIFLIWRFVLLVVGCWFEAISVCNHITCVSKLSCKFIDGVAAQPRPVSSSRRLPF